MIAKKRTSKQANKLGNKCCYSNASTIKIYLLFLGARLSQHSSGVFIVTSLTPENCTILYNLRSLFFEATRFCDFCFFFLFSESQNFGDREFCSVFQPNFYNTTRSKYSQNMQLLTLKRQQFLCPNPPTCNR